MSWRTKKGYRPHFCETIHINHDDVNAIFNDSGEEAKLVAEKREEKPVLMNAFDLISTSQGRNLGFIFEKQMGLLKRQTRFTSKLPADEILGRIEAAAKPLGFDVNKHEYKLRLLREKSGRKGHLAIATEVFEVVPSLHIVEVCKSNGDTFEFHMVHEDLTIGLKDFIWRAQDEAVNL